MFIMAKPHTRALKSFSDVSACCRYIQGLSEFPMQVTFKPGKEKRRDQQNRLAFQWYKDASEQGDHTAVEYHCLCKLWFGVEIMRKDDDFREKYDRVMGGMEYETKLALMGEPFSMPVTSIMKVDQMSEYLDTMWQHFTGRGYQMTDPAMLGIEDYARWMK